MDRRASHRRSYQAAVAAALSLALVGCAHNQVKPGPEPVAALCGSIPYPPVLTRDEVVATPPRLRRWTSGVKGALENNRCSAN
jgi:hypothetical protein